MKYFAGVVIFAALAPSLVYCQNQQPSDCRTLENAGNFVGSDEVLVGGLVCKVGKPRTNSAATQAAPKAGDSSGALLGIMEPKSLEAKQTPSSTASAETAAATAGAAPRESLRAGARPSSPAETTPYQSLGEIAREYRKDARAQRTIVPEKGELDESRRSEEAEQGKTPATDAVSAESALDRRTQASVAAAAPAMLKKSETVATPQSTALSAPTEAPQTTKSEVLAVPQAQPNKSNQEVNLVTAGPILEPALTVEASSPTAHPTSNSVPAVQGPQTEMLASAERPQKEPVADGPASGATADPPTLRPEPSVTVGSFAVPRPTSADPPPPPQAYTAEEDAAFKEGQLSTCVKNVSLGSMENEKLFLAIPDWALNWYEKNQKRFSGICFSDSLMPGARNYLIVFNTAPNEVAGTELTKVSAAGEATPRAGSFTTSYGSTWHYTYERTVTTTILSVSAEKAPHNQPAELLYATAYSDQGLAVARHSARSTTKRDNQKPARAGKGGGDFAEFQGMVGLLSRMVEDIAKL